MASHSSISPSPPSSSSSPPCAACKLLRRKCLRGCIFAPYFPPEEPHKFAVVHRVFGASNVGKLLNEIPHQQRQDCVSSLAYEAEARVRDPVYGCVGAISVLQKQVHRLQRELDHANERLLRYAAAAAEVTGSQPVTNGACITRDEMMIPSAVPSGRHVSTTGGLVGYHDHPSPDSSTDYEFPNYKNSPWFTGNSSCFNGQSNLRQS